MKKVIAFIALSLCLTVAAFSQGADTVAYNPAVTSPDGIAGLTTSLIHSLPNGQTVLSTCLKWLPIVLAVLACIQFVLKRIPTPYSVKITGLLGWILDLLTAFQKDIKSLSVLVLIGLTFLLGSCTTSKSFTRSVFDGACTVYVYTSYTTPSPGSDTTAGVPAILQGKDTFQVGLDCDNEKLLKNYPTVARDLQNGTITVEKIITQVIK